MNLLYESFPDTADGLPVVTDFREWIKFHDLLTDKEVPEHTKIFLMADWFLRPPLPLKETHVKALLDFYLVKPLDPHADEEEENKKAPPPSKPPAFDYSFDAAFLLADFRQFYQIDLLKIPYLHWFEFRSLLNALPEESSCQKRIAYRSIDLREIKDKNEKKRIRKIKRSIAIPFEMSDEAIGEALMNSF